MRHGAVDLAGCGLHLVGEGARFLAGCLEWHHQPGRCLQDNGIGGGSAGMRLGKKSGHQDENAGNSESDAQGNE